MPGREHVDYPFGEYLISTNPDLLDIEVIHRFLCTESYWAPGIPFETVLKSAQNALNFGLYCESRQIGYARVITDKATFAYLCDVFVLQEYRGKGLAHHLMRSVLQHPELPGLRRWMLLTSSSPGLYKKYGFEHPPKPELYMEKSVPNIYLNNQ